MVQNDVGMSLLPVVLRDTVNYLLVHPAFKTDAFKIVKQTMPRGNLEVLPVRHNIFDVYRISHRLALRF